MPWAQPLTARIEGLPIVDEHALVDDNRYVADVLADFRVGRAGREYAASKLLFRKRMFRETDESILEPVFISLSYVQAQYDYLQVRGDAFNPKDSIDSALTPHLVCCGHVGRQCRPT